VTVYSDTDFWREQGLSKSDIEQTGSVEIRRNEGNISYQPSSIDLHLGPEFLVMREQQKPIVVDERETYPEYDYRYATPHFVIKPDDFVLGVTQETVSLASDVVAFMWGRSSVGRLGIRVHNAGLVDPAFEGQLVLELKNETPNEIALKTGMRICQMTVHELDSLPSQGYDEKVDEKYQSQSGVVSFMA